MSIVFNAEEVLKMAETIEINGGKFYRKAAENNEAGRELLTKIAEQEDEHVAIFAAMRASLDGSEEGTTAYDPGEEGAMYLRVLADANVFDMSKDPSETLSGNETLEEIIKTGIVMEKDSIVFYSSLKQMVPESLGGAKLDAIIAEEVRHISWLSEKLSEIRA